MFKSACVFRGLGSITFHVRRYKRESLIMIYTCTVLYTSSGSASVSKQSSIRDEGAEAAPRLVCSMITAGRMKGCRTVLVDGNAT